LSVDSCAEISINLFKALPEIASLAADSCAQSPQGKAENKSGKGNKKRVKRNFAIQWSLLNEVVPKCQILEQLPIKTAVL
jgi:hypothetical protein